MDERLSELLNRYLDGDLAGAERSEFEQLLADDEVLAAELANTRRIRRAVAMIADEMDPPAALDEVIKPLRQSAPAPAPRVRPVYRWLGAAAAVVLGVTVALEVVRRNPEPTIRKPSLARETVQDDGEIFQLAPLPTAVPDEDRPLGATDQLLEEDLSQPDAPEPRALEIVGPLSNEEFSAATDQAPPAPSDELSTSVPVAPPADVEKPMRSKGAAVDADPSVGLDTGRADEKRAAVDEERQSRPHVSSAARIAQSGKGERDRFGGGRQLDSLPVVVVVDGVEIWRGWSPGCAVGRWQVELQVIDGVVVDITSAPTATPDEPAETCRPDGLIGSTVAGAADGGLAAELVVDPPQ